MDVGGDDRAVVVLIKNSIETFVDVPSIPLRFMQTR